LDSFESIIKTLFEAKGYWVKTCLKVELTKAEKRRIGRPSSPRWELDVVAYQGGTNEILVIECKSFLDSPGVKAASLMGGKASERYKLFNDDVLRNVVFTRLTTQLAGSGACPKDATVRLCLAAGKVASKKDREELTSYFKLKDWGFYSDDWIRRELRRLASFGYENEISIVTTKILNREPT
jgi:hypothetical protein